MSLNQPAQHRIALLFNANKSFDREVMAGIAAYLASTRVSWDLFLEEDFRMRLSGIENWQGDGVIADFDDPAVSEALALCRVPVVAVGGSYEDATAYPANIPYVATDNYKLIKLAYHHLIEAGLTRFACFSLPAAPTNRWAQEREKAFTALTEADGFSAEIFRGQSTSAPSWGEAVEQQVAWLRGLPKPIGIIAVTDARARQLLQACTIGGISVPEEVALIGVDNDPLARLLGRIPLSSVIQGSEEMGRTAAHLLHQMLTGGRPGPTRIVVPPVGINVRDSTRFEVLSHPHVMRARHFIRHYACQGIKTGRVADYVGISRSSLEACFRAELGRSVHDEILRVKLEAANAILAREPGNIADIAQRCGFSSEQYMHAVFKREFGCTPRELQRRMLEAAAASPDSTSQPESTP